MGELDAQAIKRGLLKLALAALCVAALIAIAAIVGGRLDRTEGQVLLTHVVVLVYSLFALSSSTVATRKPRLALAGWASSACGALLAIVAIWTWRWYGSPDLHRLMGIFFASSFTLAHVSLIVSRERDLDGPQVRAISTATVGCVCALGVLVSIAVAGLPHGPDISWYLRLMGVIGVLDLLGTIALPIARKVERSASTPS